MGGRCVYSTYVLATNNGISIYSKQISLGVEKQYIGSATVVSAGVLGVTYPAYRMSNTYVLLRNVSYLIKYLIDFQLKLTRITMFWILTTKITL